MAHATDGSSIYERYGVKPLIHASGSTTRYGGTLMEPAVMRAMEEASRYLVNMDKLNLAAGEIVAGATGAEAGLVSAGSASSMTLQAAACMTGTDPARINRLPDSSGMKHEIIIQRGHKVNYDQSYRAAGATLVEIGNTRGTQAWELEAAINENTAAVAYIVAPWLAPSALSLEQVAEVAHRRGVPVIVDAASTLPPAENLRRFIPQGADMVCYSGGKGIRGPQSTGMLCGTSELIQAATLNHSPNNAIGRGMKVCKEEIVGLITALELYMERDHDADMARWRGYAETVVDALVEVPGLNVVVEQDDVNRPVPTAVVYFAREWAGPSGQAVATTLLEGDPAIHILRGGYSDELAINPHNLQPGEAEIVAERLRRALLA